MIIDLRSDTVTKPTKEMLQYMFAAQVGDDVFDDDPAVNELQNMAAKMFNKEAALFCPSGTMTNQIAIKLHTQPGDEVLCDESAHVYNYEGGGIAFNANCSVRLLHGDRGRFTTQDVLNNINPDNVHFPKTSLVCAENTCNRGGGSYYSLEQLQAIQKVCKENQLAYHLDGARLFNALVETNNNTQEIGNTFDTISICLSKGLGAPVGSLLIGNNQHIAKAKRIRKVFGGGMRQAGYLAAAGIYALTHHIDRLKQDHEKAKYIGEHLASNQHIKEVLPVDTNIIIFKLKDEMDLQEQFLRLLRENNILFQTMSRDKMRFVTHLDITDAMVEKLISVLKQ
jgi:threonine aldolase